MHLFLLSLKLAVHAFKVALNIVLELLEIFVTEVIEHIGLFFLPLNAFLELVVEVLCLEIESIGSLGIDSERWGQIVLSILKIFEEDELLADVDTEILVYHFVHVVEIFVGGQSASSLLPLKGTQGDHLKQIVVVVSLLPFFEDTFEFEVLIQAASNLL